jgi:uncharacterized integral membrane protein
MSIEGESQSLPKQRWRPTGRQIIAAIIVIAALLFIFQNDNSGHFHFLWFDFQAPVWFWMLIVFAGGVATGLLFAGRRTKHKA